MPTKISRNRFQKIKSRSLRKNPLPWFLLLLVSGAWFYMFSYENVESWRTKTSEIKTFEAENPIKEQESEQITFQLKDLENEFRIKSATKKKEEDQIFPKDLEVFPVIKTLEIYAFLLNYDREAFSNFKLLSVNFSNPEEDEKLDYDISKTNISIEGSRKSIIEFIDFIERGKPTKDFEARMKTQSDDEEVAKSLAFLKNRFLPMAVVESIRIGEKSSTESNKILTANLSLNFYSRSKKIENKSLLKGTPEK